MQTDLKFNNEVSIIFETRQLIQNFPSICTVKFYKRKVCWFYGAFLNFKCHFIVN